MTAPIDPPSRSGRVFRTGFLLWLLLAGLSAAGVWAIETLGPWILLRDQTSSSWHHLETAWAIQKKGGAVFGTPEYEAALREAEPHLRKAAELSPNTGKFRIRLAHNLFEQGRTAEAWQEASRALPLLKPEDGQSYGFVGEVAVKLERWKEGEDPLRRAVELEPQVRFHRERLALCLLRQDRVEEGIEILKKRFEDLPSIPWSRIWAGGEAIRVGRWNEALEWLEVPAEQGDLGGRAWIMRAVAYAALGQIDEAALALAQNNRLMKEKFPELPDLSHVDLPELDEALWENLRAAYRKAYQARWK